MLLWVIIKTTDNGTKCLLTGLAIILCNQDRWERYKLQINPFNNEGPRCAHPVASIVAWETHGWGELQQFLCDCEPMDETFHERETSSTLTRICPPRPPKKAIQPLPKQAKDATSLSRIQSSSSAPWEHAYSACVTTTNDGRPSAYMLTAVSCPHPGNDCVINPEPLFELLLTAEGENGINCLCSPVTNALLRTLWATLTIRHCQTDLRGGLHKKWPGRSRGWPPIMRERSYGMFFNHWADEGSRPQISSQFVNSRK